MKLIKHHWELDVYKQSVDAAMRVFALTKKFPREETCSRTDQIRRSLRSVSGQIAEAWRRRKYPNVFVNKLNEGEGEAAETQVWLEYSVPCDYMSAIEGRELHRAYNRILGKLVTMGNNPGAWALMKRRPA